MLIHLRTSKRRNPLLFPGTKRQEKGQQNKARATVVGEGLSGRSHGPR